jgi:hypothetical protein
MKIVIGLFLILILGTILIGYITSDETIVGFGWKNFKDESNQFVLGLDQSSFISDDNAYKQDRFTIGLYFFAITFIFTSEIKDNIAL